MIYETTSMDISPTDYIQKSWVLRGVQTHIIALCLNIHENKSRVLGFHEETKYTFNMLDINFRI